MVKIYSIHSHIFNIDPGIFLSSVVGGRAVKSTVTQARIQAISSNSKSGSSTITNSIVRLILHGCVGF